MEKRIRELFPEIEWIEDKGMQDKVVASYVDALKTGGWEPDDMDKIPFTLLIPNCPFSYLDHVKGVTRIAKKSMDEFNAIYPVKDSKFKMDNDLLVAGALLHDVGKLVEYEKNAAGETVKSTMGKNLRHPFSGTVIALRNGCPDEIGHIIANHAHEGDGTLRSPEGVMVNKADFMNFESVKSFLGMK
jgi:putative nucleotidyltransferase with HDIG domain